MRNGIQICRPVGSPAIVVAGSGAQTASIVGQGSVDFANASSLSLNGVFSNLFDSYLIDISGVATTEANIQIRLRLAGVDSSTGYVYQQVFADGTSRTGQRQTSTAPFTGYFAAVLRSGNTVYVYGPNLAQATAGRVVNSSARTNAAIIDYAWTHSETVAYDGFTIFPQSGTFTGLISVYGLVN